jgi:hypothetical protein
MGLITTLPLVCPIVAASMRSAMSRLVAWWLNYHSARKSADDGLRGRARGGF